MTNARSASPPSRRAAGGGVRARRKITAYHRSVDQLISAVTAIALAGWGYTHWRALQRVDLMTSPLEATYVFAYLILVWQLLLLVVHPRFRPNGEQRAKLRDLRVLIPVPVHNEDPMILRRALASLIDQDRLPDIIHVVDNGSDDPEADYTQVEAWFLQETERVGILGVWERVEWKGKRLVHGHCALRWTGHAEIFLTVDSDGVLQRNAVRELVAPFANDRVQSVAGLILAENDEANVMARILNLWYTTSQLVGRASQSTLGGVTVNSGALGAYRFDVVRDNVDGYLAESFMGRDVHFSDDSLLTLYALERGRAVQNPRAVVLVAMPENWSHHQRQYMRWMRGSTIRTLWRFRYLPLRSYAYWVNLLSWTQVLASLAVLTHIFVLGPLRDQPVPWRSSAQIMCMVGYLITARYLAVRRHDQELSSQILTWLLAPIAVLWALVILRFMRWYGMLTCYKTGWGTRARVEVFYSGPAENMPDETNPEGLPGQAAREQRLPADLPAGLPADGMTGGGRASERAAEADRRARIDREQRAAAREYERQQHAYAAAGGRLRGGAPHGGQDPQSWRRPSWAVDSERSRQGEERPTVQLMRVVASEGGGRK
ncbi:glycosyltransferase [Streptomyces sp. NPDC051940]|uniref:glycosyltransferase family 2 protein n=1 Tax=Streptomyces sp. NPDC051940 TaxID=3155675 RepID=UPI003443F9FE